MPSCVGKAAEGSLSAPPAFLGTVGGKFRHLPCCAGCPVPHPVPHLWSLQTGETRGRSGTGQQLTAASASVPMMPGREMPSLQMPDKWLAPRVHQGPPTQLKHGCRLQQLPGTVAVPLQLHTPCHHTRDDLFHSKARM